MITVNRLKELMTYNQETGEFFWSVNRGSAKAGSVAGYKFNVYPGRSYIRIKVDGLNLYAHRLAYMYMTGEYPENEIDHIDGDGSNNKWANLRHVTPSLNQRNRRLQNNNKSGFCGVMEPREIHNKWTAFVRHKGKTKILGYFDKKEDAIKARLNHNKNNEFHINHGMKRN